MEKEEGKGRGGKGRERKGREGKGGDPIFQYRPHSAVYAAVIKIGKLLTAFLFTRIRQVAPPVVYVSLGETASSNRFTAAGGGDFIS